MSAASMLAAARKDLGLSGRPNRITRDYASRNGREFLSAPWCNQAITEWARKSGNAAAVLPNGDRAYTVWSAEDGKRLGRWYAGTTNNIREHALPGALMFFDWNGANSIGAIDHIGVVERNLGDGRVQTIEANSGDAVKRRVRGPSVIAGFWNPDYEGDDMPSAKDIADAVYDRLTHTLTEDLWAVREGILAEGQKIDPRTALRQIWAYGKAGYARDQEILARLDAQNEALKAMAEALAAKDGAVDPDALVERIRHAIESITVRLDTGPTSD